MNSRRNKGLKAAVLALLLACCAGGVAAEATATPTDLAEIRTLEVTVEEGVQDERQEIWHVARQEEALLIVRWDAAQEDTAYRTELTLPDGTRRSDTFFKARAEYPEKELPAGEYTLIITAVAESAVSGTGKVKILLEEAPAEPAEETPAEEAEPAEETPAEDTPAEEAEPAGETPAEETEPAEEAEPAEETSSEAETGDEKAPGEGGEQGGKKPSGGGRSSGGTTRSGGTSGGKKQAAAITPGKALTTAHARGSGTAVPYGTVALILPEEPMEILTLDGEELKLQCGGHPFTGEILEDCLTLRSEDGENGWSVTKRTLQTLYESGIRELVLTDGTEETALETDMEFSGAAYARERAAGYVAGDFLLTRQEDGWTVSVEDRVYTLSEWRADKENGEST